MRFSAERIRGLAAALGVAEADLFEAVPERKKDVDSLVAEARRIAAKLPGIEFDDVWHTLLVLRETPLQRLQGSLRRGRAAPLW